MSMAILVKAKTKKADLSAQAGIKKYKNLAPRLYARCLKLAKGLKNTKVIHINSARDGGGVAELLKSQVPMEKSLGVDSAWFYIKAPKEFFIITKKIHNLLQGKDGNLSKKEMNFYLKQSKALSKSLDDLAKKEGPDIVVFHDPQTMAAANFLENKNFYSVLRLHIDLSEPDKKTLRFAKQFIGKFDKIMLTSGKYRPKWLERKKVAVSKPAINPFTEKNKAMPRKKAERILKFYGMDPKKPVISQISRFDPWKDPVGVIRAYRIAKKEVPGLQLALAGFFEAQDDPEMSKVYKKIKNHSAKDKDIFIFSDLKTLKEKSDDPLINSLYTASDVVLQKSIREGFGLTVTEAMWKKKPVIGGTASGIKLQIKNGQNGFLAASPEEAGKLIVKLLKDKKLRKNVGEKARKTVKEKFLMPRLILDFLKIYSQN